jgi:pilus assembly protein CpaC
VSLRVEPTILKDHRIALKIKPSVSELDFTDAVALQGFTIPAIKTRETETTVDVNESESLILAGLMFESGSNANEKVPYLGDIPILGKLFQRQRETHEEQELIVTVTPRLVSAGQQDRSQQTRLLNSITPLTPADSPYPGGRPPSARAGELPR